MLEESNISKCRRCFKLKIRKFVGYFPDGKNKKYVDEEGKQYRGRVCPSCVRKEVKEKIRKKRSESKKLSEVSDS